MQPETKLTELPGRSPARGFGRWLIWLASGYLAVGLTTAALSGLSSAVAPATGTVAAQLQHVHQHLPVYEASFIASSLIALFAVPLMLALAFGPAARRRAGVREQVAAAFFIMYAPLATIAYTSQYALLPRLLDSGQTQTAAIWYFGSHSSLPWFLDVLAYTFFAFGASLSAPHCLPPGSWLRRRRCGGARGSCSPPAPAASLPSSARHWATRSSSRATWPAPRSRSRSRSRPSWKAAI
jgi:hypothetical protein